MLGCSQGSGGRAPSKPWIRADGMDEQSEPRAIGTGSRLVLYIKRQWCTVICSWHIILCNIKRSLTKQPLSYSHSLFGCFSALFGASHMFWGRVFVWNCDWSLFWQFGVLFLSAKLEMNNFWEEQGGKMPERVWKKISKKNLIFWRPDWIWKRKGGTVKKE
jgi:hypothetical protein